MAYLGILAGLVALVQGVAWLGTRTPNAEQRSRRHRRGAVLAPVGFLLTATSVLWLLVPGFW